MNLTLDIGALVVDKIFLGNMERVHSRGRKDASFRKLAAFPCLPFSVMRIWRAVGVYELVSRMPGVAKNTNLSVSHLYAVLGLPHTQRKSGYCAPPWSNAGQLLRWRTKRASIEVVAPPPVAAVQLPPS